MTATYVRRFASPLRDLARFFEKSRDRWKAKHQELKASNKKMLKKTRAVEKSRELWRKRARAAEQRLAALECEMEDLKFRRLSASLGSNARGETSSGPS